MAVGFPPHAEDSEHFDLPFRKLVAAVEDTLDELHWKYSTPDEGRFSVSFPPMIFVGWGERMTIDVDEDGFVTARSECSFPLQWFDWGKNAAHVSRFFRQLEDVLADGEAEGRRGH